MLACFAFIVPYGVLLFGGAFKAFANPDVSAELLAPLRISIALACAVTALALATALAGVITASWAAGSPANGVRPRPALVALLTSIQVLPSGISVLVLGLGLWLAYGRWVDPFEGSFAAMAILQATLFVPLAFRTLWPVAMGTQTRLLEAAATLGARPIRAFWIIEWPRWRGPLATAAGVIAGASLGEVAAVSLFYSENLIPLPLLVARWMGQYRFEEARAVAGLLLLLSAGTVSLVTLGGIFSREIKQ